MNYDAKADTPTTTACSPEPEWTANYFWACACGHVYDHSGRVGITSQHVDHVGA